MEEVEECDDDDDEEEEDEESEQESEDENSNDTQEIDSESSTNLNLTVEEIAGPIRPCTIDDFIKNPSIDNFLGLGPNRESAILAEAMKNIDTNLEAFTSILMKVSSLCSTNKKDVSEESLKCGEILYKQLFVWAKTNNKMNLVNNTLLVYLGLIKV